jgi:hypothetical protein
LGLWTRCNTRIYDRTWGVLIPETFLLLRRSLMTLPASVGASAWEVFLPNLAPAVSPSSVIAPGLRELTVLSLGIVLAVGVGTATCFGEFRLVVSAAWSTMPALLNRWSAALRRRRSAARVGSLRLKA